jgi:hypothetical protein
MIHFRFPMHITIRIALGSVFFSVTPLRRMQR